MRETLVMFGRTWWPVNLWAGAALLAAVAFDLLLARRVRASWRLVLYAAVLLRALLPVEMGTPLGVLRAGVPAASSLPVGAFSPLMAAPQVAPQQAPIWAAGVLLLGLGWAAARLALALRLRSARMVQPATFGHESLGPLVVGIFRPRLVVPWAVLQQPVHLAAVLAHERAHLARRDPLLAAALALATIALWPVLPVWLAVRRMRALMELACDEVALAGADPTARRHYGETLLALADRRLALGLRFGAGVRARIRALRHVARLPALLQGALCVGVVTLTLACAGTQPAPSPAFTGRQVDLDFRGAPLANILRLMSDVGGINIWIDSDLRDHQPAVTIKVHDRPWDQVLDEICRSHGLAWQRNGAAILVSRAPLPARPYLGKNVAVDFQGDIREAMRALSAAGQVPIEVADDVDVRLSMKGHDMPWDQALDVIVWSRGLRVERRGDGLRVERAAAHH